MQRLLTNPAASSALRSLAHRLPARIVYGPPYLTVRTLLDRADSGEDIAPQLSIRLASVLRTAITRVPYYRGLGLGIQPDEIRPENAYEVLSRFPYLEKSAVMRSPESFVSDAHEIRHLKLVTSGGSTGQGIKLYRDASLRSAEAGFIQHQWAKVGYSRSARVVRMGVEGRKKEDEEPCARSDDRLLISPYHFNEKWIARIYEEIAAFKPQFFHAYPSCFEYLADYMNRSGLRLSGVSGIFLASERVTERQLSLTERAFEGVPVVILYGLGERTNLAWGSLRDGEITYEFERAYGYSENFRHDNGAHEIVGTSYWNDVMPLIRYRTQDYGEIRDGVMRNLEGREQEFLVTRSGARIPGFSIVIDQFTWDYVEVFQVVQKEKGRVEFRIKPRPQYHEGIGDAILASHQAKWGDFFDLSLVLTDHIERTPSGKIRHFVVDVPE